MLRRDVFPIIICRFFDLGIMKGSLQDVLGRVVSNDREAACCLILVDSLGTTLVAGRSHAEFLAERAGEVGEIVESAFHGDFTNGLL